MEKLVSIVIPIYNAEDYLRQCIFSVLNQTYQNIEVILVNDGSTDTSGNICREFALCDNRIRYIEQSNQGVTKARKEGARLSKGEYIGFVDADDYIEPDMYYSLMLNHSDFDLIISQWFREEGGQSKRSFDKIAIGPYRTLEDMDFIFSHLINVSSFGGGETYKSGFVGYMVTKLFKTELANRIFQEINESISIGEDCEFTYRYILNCKSILVTDICGYHYRIHNKSAVHSPDSDCNYLINICKLYSSLKKAFESSSYKETLIPQLEYKITSMLSKAPKKMGFTSQILHGKVVFPFIDKVKGSNVAVYGGGELGSCYIEQMRKWKLCNIRVWVDENWKIYQREGKPIASIDELLKQEYDYLILALENEEDVKRCLKIVLPSDVNRTNILWQKPYTLS